MHKEDEENPRESAPSPKRKQRGLFDDANSKGDEATSRERAEEHTAPPASTSSEQGASIPKHSSPKRASVQGASAPKRRRTRDWVRNPSVQLPAAEDDPEQEKDEASQAGAGNAPQKPPAPRRTEVSLEFDELERGQAAPAATPSSPTPRPPSHLPPASPETAPVAAPGAAEMVAQPKALSVSEITGRLRRHVERNFDELWVVGEVSGLSPSEPGHLFFTLKDDFARLKCVMWQSNARRLPFELKNGLDVLVRGSLSMYEPQGQVQLYVTHAQPQGIGALQLAFEQLKARLHKEGLFAPERKRPLPFLPRCVAVVTSRHGAALRDVHKAMQRRFPGMPILLADARVQGEGAVEELVGAIRRLNRYAARGGYVDVLLLTRGGGSYEDLVAFNDEALARAIASSRIPIVSAVGHQVDTTIADFVADARASTPTDGARLVVPERAELEGQVSLLSRRITTAMRHRLHELRGTVREAQSRLERSSPQAQLRDVRHRLNVLNERLAAALARRVSTAQSRLDRAREALVHLDPARALLPRVTEHLQRTEERLARAMATELRRRRERLAAAAQTLEAYSPLKVLARGYSVTLDEHGHALLDTEDLAEGDEVRTLLHRGVLRSRITAIEPPPSDSDSSTEAS